MVGYLYMRNKGVSYQEAGCFAAAMCTIKLQTHGPFCGTEAEIRRIITPASNGIQMFHARPMRLIHK